MRNLLPKFKRSRLTRRQVLRALPAAVAAGLLAPMRADSRTLYLYNWDDYMSGTVLEEFATEFNCHTNMDLFADSEEQFAKLRLGNSGYDVSFPSNDFVERLWRNNLLEPLDHSQLPNLGNLDDRHLSPGYDPDNRYSVAYMWGVMGLAYRKSAVAPPTSWQDVFTPTGLQNKGRVAWLSEASSVYNVVAISLGKDPNDYSAATQQEVFDHLAKAVPHLTAVAPDTGQDLLAAGEVDVTLEWNGDIAALMEEDDDIGFVIPPEGTIYFVDCMVIPRGAPNPDLGHTFINYILQADVGQELAEYIGYATPNKRSYGRSSSTYRQNRVIFPPREIKLTEPQYPGEDALRLLYNNWQLLFTS